MKNKIMKVVAILGCCAMIFTACGNADSTEPVTETKSVEAVEKIAYLQFSTSTMDVVDGSIQWYESEMSWEAKFPSEYGEVVISGVYDKNGKMTAEKDNMDGHGIGDTETLEAIQACFTDALAGKFTAPLAYKTEEVDVKGGLLSWDEKAMEWSAEYPTAYGDCIVSGTFDDEGILTAKEDNMGGHALGDVENFQGIFNDARKGIFVSGAAEGSAEDNALSAEVESFETDNKWKTVIADIARTYNPEERNNDIIFYGASNFARWYTMEDDLAPYDVQNHAFGGSTDKDLELWAEYMLYPYNPQYVFFQTGSNDYVESTAATDEEKVSEAMEFKKKMFAEFHEKLPNAKFIVMSGILLPGRTEYVDMTLSINDQLREFCDENDYMIYVDAESLTYDRNSKTFVDDVESLFVEDQIHLTDAARITWAENWILPLMKELNMPTL